MKHALIFSPYFDTHGGGEVYSLSFAKCLEDQGYQIHFAWYQSDFLHTAAKQHHITLKNPILNREAHQLLTTQGKLATKTLLMRQFDLIFFVSDGSIPWLFGRRNLLHFQVPFTSLTPTLTTKLKLSRINHIIVNSRFTQSVINAKLHTHSHILYPPVSTKFPHKTKTNLILSVGRFTDALHHKRQDVLIEAYKRLYQQGLRHWTLALAGSTHEGKKLVIRLKKQARGYPIQFFTDIDRSGLENLYAQAKIFWFVTGFNVDETKHPELVEHFGISLVEAMAAGAIPIAIRKGGPAEIISQGQTGYLFSTLTDLLDLTRYIIDDYQTLYPQLAPKLRHRAAYFSTSKFCHRLHQLIS